MKKILTLLALMVATVAMVAAGYTLTRPAKDAAEAPKGTVVGEDGYQPNGAAFTWTTPINWDTQKLVASIDVSNCSGTNENILSVGSSISEWAVAPHAHFYYTASTKTLQFNVMTPDNKSRYDIKIDGNTVEIEFSKEKGLVINGTQYLNQYNTATQYESLEAYLEATAPFWALTELQVGGCQGDVMSNATYNYVRVVDLVQAPEPTVYTEKASATYGGTTVENEDQVVEITETEEGKYTVVCKQLILGTNKIADFTAEGVEGTLDEDGYVNYNFEGEATVSNVDAILAAFGTLAEGDKLPFTIVGKSKDGRLAAKVTTTYYNNPAVVIFGDYTEETPDTPNTDAPEGTVVGEDNYAPNGAKFNWPATINWDTQKLVVAVDASTCSSYLQNEGILSVGQDIASWSGTHFHFYYTRYSNNLQINYLGSTGVRHDYTVSGDDLVFEFSKEKGVTVNGQDFNYGVTTDFASAYADFFAMNNIEVGSQEGNTRSYATYKYVRVVDLPAKEPEVTDTYTLNDVLKYTVGTETTKVDDATITVNTYDDGTNEMVFNGLGDLGDLAVKGVEITEQDGNTLYAGTDLEATAGDKNLKVSINGEKNAEGYAYITFTVLDADDDTYALNGVFGTNLSYPRGTVVGEDDYEHGFKAFSWTTPINWDKQYFKASIDLTNCKYTNENVLSLGDNISAWGGSNGRIHFYYTPNSNGEGGSLQFNVLAPEGMSRWDVATGNTVEIEISNEKGIVIDGVQYLNKYNSSEQYASVEDFVAASAPFWALTEIEVGSTQGEMRSNAKFNYIRIINKSDKQPEIVSSENLNGTLTTIDANENSHEMTDKTVTVDTYDDGTCGMTFKGVESATDELGDIIIKGITVTEDENGTHYAGEGTVTVTDENSSLYGKDIHVAVSGVKDAEGNYTIGFNITTPEDADYQLYGEFKTAAQVVPEGTEFKGIWGIVQPYTEFDGSVFAKQSGDGLLDLFVQNFYINGKNVGNFTIKNVPASVAEDGTINIGAANKMGTYEVEYEGTAPENAVKKLQSFYGTIKNKEMSLVTGYLYYGDNNNYLTVVEFNGTSENDINVGINGVNAGLENGNAEIFTIGGVKVNGLQKGINIVRTNGKTVKVVKK